MNGLNRDRDIAWGWFLGVAHLFGMFLWCPSSSLFQAQPTSQSLHDPRWDQMISQITDRVDGYKGEVGLYIKDLRSGRTFERQADQPFVSASLIKLPILAAAFQAVLDGKVSFDSKLRYQRSEKRGGSGILKWFRSGSYFSFSNLLTNMITHSDNTATAMVIDRLGYGYLNQCFKDFGLTVTRISPTGMSLSNHLNPEKDNYTTAKEMGELLEKIYFHHIVGDEFSLQILGLLKAANSRNRLGKNLPKTWSLARKTGLLRNNCHDVGIVFTPSGDYVICVLTRQNNYRMAKNLISTIGKTAYDSLGT